ncbi:MAG: patatin-like phospholipase family protein [Chromatocurvus sp.]
MAEALQVFAGREAARRLARGGWSADQFSLLLGASGGPKWFVLAALDRYLFGDFLQDSRRPLATLGSSIGAWRHACLAQPDPVAALDRFADAYIHQTYGARPDSDEITAASLGILQHLLGGHGAAQGVGHPRIRQHVVTARGRGPCGGRHPLLLPLGLAGAAAGNALDRRLLQRAFQRVLFSSSSEPVPGLPLADFATCRAPLTAGNAEDVLLATASIPLLLNGVRDIENAPPGQYWDGGVIDYHFDLQHYSGHGLVLFPHFSSAIVPGWFDKTLRRRHTRPEAFDNLVLLSPDPAFVASLPAAKIPDRTDFRRFTPEQRIRNWEACLQAGEAMAEGFRSLVDGEDPLRGVLIPGDG